MNTFDHDAVCHREKISIQGAILARKLIIHAGVRALLEAQPASLVRVPEPCGVATLVANTHR